MCGKKTLKHQQCWLQDVRCGEICGKPLKCGSHFCQKQCHKAGACEDSGGATCQQACGKPKKACGHADESICHAIVPCKEDKPCASKIIVTCPCQVQKQEMKCCASKTSQGNSAKSLACNEECARLERNRRLALALNVSPSHEDGGDHIPYSDETLSIFHQTPKWARTQEREFRVFATSSDEKRLRFKPMPRSQRVFLHSLAADFGLDAESMDPEPHRHVAVFKTPRFVSAPNKTLTDCARIQARLRAELAKDSTPTEENVQQTRQELFDSLVLTNPKFGLTLADLRAELDSATTTTTTLLPAPVSFDIEFLADEILLKPRSQNSEDPAELDKRLRILKPALAAALSAKEMGTVLLCRTDPFGSEVVDREDPSQSAADGWSRVAAKGVASRRVVAPAVADGSGNAFWALRGAKVTFVRQNGADGGKSKKEPDEVVDDWETAAADQDELERGEENHEELSK